jgi:hypothetical protein
VKAQGIALGLRYQPTKKAPTGRNNAAQCRWFRPVGALASVRCDLSWGVAPGYHILPRWGGIAGRGRRTGWGPNLLLGDAIAEGGGITIGGDTRRTETLYIASLPRWKCGTVVSHSRFAYGRSTLNSGFRFLPPFDAHATFCRSTPSAIFFSQPFTPPQ